MEWIDINEKKPENFSFVLASIKREQDNWVEIVGYCNGFQLPGRGDTTYATHWMPIPQPPKQ
jgi:hypothetical protein